MPEVSEREVYNALLRYKGSGKINMTNTEVSFSFTPIDIHGIDSPDSLLWIEVSLKLFGQTVKLKIPIAVEAEKGGIDYAMEDLQKFVKREHYPIEIPMIVVAESGYDTREHKETFPAKFTISQIPVRQLKEK